MNALIGDIGNTITKLCLVDTKNFKPKKVIYFDSNCINKRKLLEKKLRRILKKNIFIKFALISSVVPNYELKLKNQQLYAKFKIINLKQSLINS